MYSALKVATSADKKAVCMIKVNLARVLRSVNACYELFSSLVSSNF